MAQIGNFILRFIVIGFGFSLAIFAAGLFIGYGFYNEILSTEPPMQMWEEEFFSVISMGVGVASTMLIGAYGIGVVAIVIILAEVMRWNGIVSNLVMGGACALYLALTHFGGEGISDGALLVSLSAGFIGGFVYWLIAGRSAGKWLAPTGGSSSKSSQQKH